MVQGETSEALERYERARHIARVSYGLFDPRQMPVLYRESAALTRLGRLRAAGEREEQAYEVARRVYDEYDPELLPALFRLADFYLETYNYLAARALYNRAYAIHEANHTDGTDQAIPALQGIARSHRLERFPPVYVHNSADNRLQGPTPGLTNDDLESQHLTFNNFPAGEKALQRIVEIRRNTTEPDPKATRDAIMELADWHLMFGRSNAANTLYVHVFEEMQKAGEDPLPLFNQPQMIYLPKPHDPKPPPPGQRESQTQGYVKLSFTISPTGRVRNLQTVESQPKDLMDFRVRRSMRLAVFRPRIAGGEPIGSDDQQFTYEFAYFPEPGSAAAHATDSEAPAETEVDTNDA
jgi:TonB family protein